MWTKSINIYDQLTEVSHLLDGIVWEPVCLYTDAIPNEEEIALTSLTLIGDHIMTKVIVRCNTDLTTIRSKIRDPPPMHLASCLSNQRVALPPHLLEQLGGIKIVEPVVWNTIGHTLELLHEAQMREENAYHEYSENDVFFPA